MKMIKMAMCLIMALSILRTDSFGQTHDWVRTNPGGGGAFSTVGAGTSGIILAGSDLSGAYRSADGGQSWDVIGASKGLTETHVSGVGFHRTDGNILFIGTENGIFRSKNGGNSVKHALIGGYITDIEFATNNSSTGYASYHPAYNSNNGVVYKSVDNGQSWSQVSSDLPSGIRILKVLVNPLNANMVYILTGRGRFACGPADVFGSTNGGVNWTNLTSSLPEILDVAIDPVTPQDVYVTTQNASCSAQFYWTNLGGNLYKSIDGGATWGSPISGNTGIIWVDPVNPVTLRLIDPREPYPWIATAGTRTSTDGGLTFTKTGDVNDWDTFFNEDLYHSYGTSFNGISKTLGEDLSDPETYYWVTSQWVYKTEDHGTIFNNIFTNEISPGFWRSRGFDNVNMTDISISKANSNILFLAYFDIGIWRSLDHGESWQSCNDDFYSGNWDGDGGNCASVLTDSERANVVWATMSQNQHGQPPTYLLKSIDTGEKSSWVLSNTGLPNEQVTGLSLDEDSPLNSRTLFVTAQGDVYKSTDDGASWSMVLNCNTCRFTAVDQFNGDIIYAGGGASGIWRSSNGGSNWTDVSHSEMISTSVLPFWNRNYEGMFDIQTDPNHPDWLYVTVLGDNRGLYRSTDQGNTWVKILTDDYMRKVAIAPQNSKILYATSSSAFASGGYKALSKGVLFSDDGGATWTQQNQNMAYPFAMSVAIDYKNSPTVFVGSPGTGFQKAAVDLPSNAFPTASVDSLLIFPNHTINQLELEKEYFNRNLRIFNLAGQLVLSSGSGSGSITTNLSKLRPGIYFVSILNSKNSKKQIFKMILH